MTLIVGIEHEGAVYMGADSGGWREGFEDAGTSPKVVRRGAALIGENIARQCVPVGTPPEDGDVEAWLVRRFVPQLREAVKEHGAAKNLGDSGAEGWGGWIVMAIAGEIWTVSGAYCVFRDTRGYVAIGASSGVGVARGVLYATPHLDPASRIRMALDAAADHTDSVRPPFVFETLPREAA